MGLVTQVYLVALVGSGAIALALAAYTYRNRSRTEMLWFAALMTSTAVWSAGQVVETTATDFTTATVGQGVIYLGVVLTVFFWVLFALEYTDHEEYVTARSVALLSIHPVVVTVATWSNPLHGLVWPGRTFAPGTMSNLTSGWGPLLVGHFLYSYVAILAGQYLLVRMFLGSRSLYRGQIAALVVGTTVPLVANVLFSVGVVPVDLTSAAFLVTGLAVFGATYRFEFSDLTPVARKTVVDEMAAATFVLDEDDRVIDVNPTGRAMLGLDPGEAIGAPAATVFSSVPQLYERYADVRAGTDEVSVDAGEEVRHYRVEVTPLSNDRDDAVGRLIVVRDVTDRRERERELERQNEQLDQFASLVSHDLRNPLNVADGYLELVEQRADDPELAEYADRVASSHERMRRIIDDVLTMARQGHTIDETDPVDLDALVAEAWSNVETTGATLENDLHGVVEADRGRLLHLFENLFRNAVEHGSTGSPNAGRSGDGVTVRVGPITSGTKGAVGVAEAGFFVADDGTGIPEDRRESVFEAGHTTHEDGTGLGLSIVEQVVEAHGWQVRVTGSEAGGARFEVTGVPGIRVGVESGIGTATD